MFINRAVTAFSAIGGVVAIIIALLYGNPLLPLIAAAFFTMTMLLWRYGYLFIPVITKATNIIEMRGAYEVPSTRDYIIKKNESGYYASKFLEVRFYESSMDKSGDEKRTMFESFERAISSLKYIVKISLMVSTLDLSKHIDEIKTKRSSAEAKKAKETKLARDESLRLDRELAYWNRLLDRITQGERPVEVIAFASTTAFGLTRDEALSRVSRQSKELKTILSSSLGCDVRHLKDLDMLKCFEWEYFFPTTQEEIKDLMF
jgi:hypothetical protein